MKQAKHTPAPWRMEIIGRSEKRLYVTRVTGDESGICCEIQMSGDSPTCEDLANARLVESAPELLEALRVLVACSKGASPITYSSDCVTDAIALIRKVEGGAK